MMAIVSVISNDFRSVMQSAPSPPVFNSRPGPGAADGVLSISPDRPAEIKRTKRGEEASQIHLRRHRDNLMTRLALAVR